MTARRRLVVVLFMLAGLVTCGFAAACGPSSARPCRADDQCDAGQVCEKEGDADVGACIVADGGGGEGEPGEGEGEPGEGEGEPAGPHDAVAVDVGTAFACAVDGAQRVQCWGTNFRGQLGRTTTGSRDDAPAPVRGLSGVTLLAVGDAHACAFGLRAGDAHRALVCWGDATEGNLGVTGAVETGVHVVAALTLAGEVTALDADGDNNGGLTCASDGDDTECFGAGLPVTSVPSLRNVDHLAVSLAAVCGTKRDDGAIVCVDVRNASALPAPLGCAPQTSCATLNAANDYAVVNDGVCVVDDGGAVRCAGDNTFGVVVPDAPSAETRDVAVVVGSGAMAVDVGTQHACAVVDGGVLCWGRPVFGATGVLEEAAPSTCATPNARCQPVTRVALPFARVVEFETHRTNSCVRSSGGRVACFGSFVDDAHPAAREFALAD